MNNFVSENVLAEKRKARQEEWEKTRKADDPLEAPEEKYDPRSLYERLQEVKDKKQSEFDESIKFKNQFRGIDEDEADFLTNVQNRANDIERKKRMEEEKELDRLLSMKKVPEKDETIIKVSEACKQALLMKSKKQSSQLSRLKGAIKRKAPVASSVTNEKSLKNISSKTETELNRNCSLPKKQNMGIPGLGGYGSDSSSSEDES